MCGNIVSINRSIKMRILLVEDNKSISMGLVYSLEKNGYEVDLCETFKDSLCKAPFDYDVIILDITLPDGNGFELYKIITKSSKSPVLFLTALDDEDNVVNGLELGAEDYITKPFSTREFLVRLKRIAARNTTATNIIHIGNVSVDTDKAEVYDSGNKVDFTALEYRIFSLLVQNQGKVVTRELVLEKIWDIAGNYVNDNTLTVYIKRIRKKLSSDIIKTVKGLGYMLEDRG